MKILAIDLGETTGLVSLLDEALEWNEAVPLDLVVEKTRGLTFDYVIIERPAYRGTPRQNERYDEVIGYLRGRFGVQATVKVCRPADWMPRFHSYPLPERGRLRTEHEKDAYRMAHWALDKFKEDKP